MKDKIEKIWDRTYKESLREELGWYEAISEPSLSLIKKYHLDRSQKILDAGCGESTLIQSLIDNNFKDIEGIDLSLEAINFQKKNLKNIQSDSNIVLRKANLTEGLKFERKGMLWHDRAVFHFIFEESLRESYKKNIKNFLDDNGIFILALFSKENEAEKCNGFLVNKQSIEEVNEFFKDSFLLKETLEYDYKMPWGDVRKYIYCIFSKI